MFKNVQFIVLAIIFAGITGCLRKTKNPVVTTTSVSGSVVGTSTGRPASNVQVELYGLYRAGFFDKEPSPKLLTSARTDNWGNYLITHSTIDELDSMFVTLSGSMQGMKKVEMGRSNTGFSFSATEKITLKQTYTVINNANPPLRITGPFYQWKDVYAADTIFTVFGKCSPGNGTCSSYGYFNEKVYHRSDSCYEIRTYVDTLEMTFLVDASTF